MIRDTHFDTRGGENGGQAAKVEFGTRFKNRRFKFRNTQTLFAVIFDRAYFVVSLYRACGIEDITQKSGGFAYAIVVLKFVFLGLRDINRPAT